MVAIFFLEKREKRQEVIGSLTKISGDTYILGIVSEKF